MVQGAETELLREIQSQAKGGPNVEPQTAALWGALLRDKENVAVRGILSEAAEAAKIRGVGRAAAASALRTEIIYFFRTVYGENGGSFSDENLLDTTDWKGPMEILKIKLKDGNGLAVDRAFNTGFEGAITPVKERYNIDEVLAQVVSERFPQGAQGLDVGSSIMAGSLQLMYKDEFPMSADQITIEPPISNRKIDATAHFNKLLERPGTFRNIVAIDTYPFYEERRQSYDIGDLEKAFSGLRPSERNSDYVRDLRALISKKQSGSEHYDGNSRVVFQRTNLLDDQELADFKDEVGSQFDIIIANYLTQELTPEDFLRIHNIFQDLRSPNGLIAYTHQVYRHPVNKKQPYTAENLVPYKNYATEAFRSVTHVDDALNPIGGIGEAARWLDNRCRIGRLGTAPLIVNGRPEPFFDLVRHA